MLALQFGPFEFDTSTYELRTGGTRVKIQRQPARVLALLAKNPGTLITRNQIREAIWGDATFVDFEQGLNFCIRQIRIALNENADRPEFIETLPRMGYRFIAAVDERAPIDARGGPARVRIGILPFDGQGESEGDYFAVALTENMFAQLSRIDPTRLRVVACSRAVQNGQAGASLVQLGKEFDLDYLLQGRVHRQAGSVRISSHLHDLRDRSVLWSQIYERQDEDLPAIQQEMAESVGRALAMELSPGLAIGWRKYSRSPHAYDAYLKGRFFWHKMTPEGMRISMRYFSQALDLDARFAPAVAGLADCYAQMGSIRLAMMRPQEAWLRARELLARAFELDDTLIEAHCTQGLLSSWYEHDWAGAGRSFRLASSLEPSNIATLLWQSLYLSAIGRGEEAVQSALRAKEAEPMSALVNTYVGAALSHVSRYEEAIEVIRYAIEIDPNYYRAYLFLGMALGWQDRHQETINAYGTARRLNPENLEAVAFLGASLAVTGDLGAAEQALELLTATEDHYEPALLKAAVYAGMRDDVKMFCCLRTAVERKACPLYILKFLWCWRDYRADTRMKELLASIRLPQ